MRSLAAHPVTLAALAVLIVNDHWAKARWPGLLTGKLSDFAGLVLMPVVLVATIELVARRPLGARFALAVALCVGAVFALVKTWVPAAELYRECWGWLAHPIDALCAMGHWLAPATFVTAPAQYRVSLARDPTDLVALPCVFVAVGLARARARAVLR
jgi:hypothetical protein